MLAVGTLASTAPNSSAHRHDSGARLTETPKLGAAERGSAAPKPGAAKPGSASRPAGPRKISHPGESATSDRRPPPNHVTQPPAFDPKPERRFQQVTPVTSSPTDPIRTTRAPATESTRRARPSRPGDPGVTWTSDFRRERERSRGRCPGMRVSIKATRVPNHSTGVVAVPDKAVTLGVRAAGAMRRPCDATATGERPTSGCFLVFTPRSLRGVTESHSPTSPGSGAVVTGVRKLTCSAISNPRRQGGDEPMSLAPEVR